jgi:hypothetical protein
MNIKFPLYDMLKRECATNTPVDKLTKKQIYEYVNNSVDTMDQTNIDYIFIIIKKHYNVNKKKNNTNSSIIPYGGKRCNNDIIIDFNKLPNGLHKILYLFSQKYNSLNN